MKNRKIKPWITNGLVTSIINRDKLNMKIKKDTSNHKLINYYKTYRNKLTKLIRKAKEQYYINKIEICKVINELSGRKIKSTGLPINQIIKDINPTSTPKDYLNIVNSYFATTGNRLVDSNFPNSTNNIQSNFGTNTNNKSSINSNFKFKTIGSFEVKNILKNLNKNSAPGETIITNGTVSDELKVDKIVPIHKKGDKTDFTNYGPISIVGILVKFLEKIIKNQLLRYLLFLTMILQLLKTSEICENGHIMLRGLNYLCEVCIWKLENNQNKEIGGPGLIVEIDEGLFVCRKNNAGTMDFSGICRETNAYFIISVPDRSEKTLSPIIKKYIRPGSVILSDYWKAYNNLQQAGFQHNTVNHICMHIILLIRTQGHTPKISKGCGVLLNGEIKSVVEQTGILWNHIKQNLCGEHISENKTPFKTILKDISDTEYLERNKILFTGQYGFRKNLGTEDALININNYLHNKRDTKKKILISFLDLEKAFDSISRQLLLNNYPSNRQQLTTIGIGVRRGYAEYAAAYPERTQSLTHTKDHF
ncbi:RNA-directed DNA polymerase from mobile element jockey [Aphis craccivora]|uniref:RNA-directed DNA polymerase from mobile element jockey n=1 Tax=Aphis craccivora TaxID=307492 RepID=A0A6G0YI54_APHCR|nr:RNA-directed DNA polymerase from mobile element jockey [Aphis craccivora]